MKKVILSLMIGLMALSFNQANACSIHPGDMNQIKDQFILKLEEFLGVPAGKIKRKDLTNPMPSFLEGLGADCSGIEASIRTSGYNFSIVEGFQNCTYKGVLISKGLEVNVDTVYHLNSEPKTCKPLTITPIRPVLSRLDGVYFNENRRAQGIVKIKISRNGKKVRAWGKCVPRNCDWGTVALVKEGASYKAHFDFGFKTEDLIISKKGRNRIEVISVKKRNGVTEHPVYNYFKKRR